jgi:hypothetical protein
MIPIEQEMIEVFKTDVEDAVKAAKLLHHLTGKFPTYHLNFDLDDCDRILRIHTKSGTVETDRVIEIMEVLGFKAEPLT